MVGMMDDLRCLFDDKGVDVHCPNIVQTMSEPELIELVPRFDGWIIGDDPATRAVFEAGLAGGLRAAVKWGIGVDNVDLGAAKELGIPVTNTPNMFGREVADVAMAYVTLLARRLHEIDRAVWDGAWVKPRGSSLTEKTMGLIGFGDIGSNVAKRALAAEMRVIAYDPAYRNRSGLEAVQPADWPTRIVECDFLVFTCSLHEANRHMLNADTLALARDGVRVVNVARGPLIDEAALLEALDTGKVTSAALDVFEVEPLPADSGLRNHRQCVFGSHNGSNTSEAVRATSVRAVEALFSALGIR
jgi:D-3-phosphoglycerate dehydrogenase